MHESALSARVEPQPDTWSRACLAALGSLKLTVVVILWLAAAVAWSFETGASATWSLAVPLALFALNLAGAIASNAVFRRQGALLVFHLALIAIVLLVAAGRMTYLAGRLELSQGETFAGSLVTHEAGPWHPWRLGEVRFENAGFEIDYAPRLRRGETRNRVRWLDGAGRMRESVIGDHTPLVLAGYRFYTSPNKGFAPRFLWQGPDGQVLHGTVHFPAYPVFQFGQTLEWNLPGSGVMVTLDLEFDEVLIDPAQAAQFRLPARHTLAVSHGNATQALRPGDRIALPGGVLLYEGLTRWMGYTVHFDPTLPWLLAAGLLAVASLAWHLRGKYRAQPWSPT